MLLVDRRMCRRRLASHLTFAIHCARAGARAAVNTRLFELYESEVWWLHYQALPGRFSAGLFCDLCERVPGFCVIPAIHARWSDPQRTEHAFDLLAVFRGMVDGL